MVFNVVFFIWLVVLTVLLLKSQRHYNRLTQGITKRDLGEVLEEILKREKGLQGRAELIETAVERLTKESAFHITKIGLVRFNPFSDTGGTQSFTVALLDGNNTGLVMTSLYGRTGNRWYVKEVKNGKAKGVELSKEEFSAIEKA